MDLKFCVAFKLFLIFTFFDIPAFPFFSDNSMQRSKYFVKSAAIATRYLQGPIESIKNLQKRNFVKESTQGTPQPGQPNIYSANSDNAIIGNEDINKQQPKGQLQTPSENKSILKTASNLLNSIFQSSIMSLTSNEVQKPTIIYRKDYTPPHFTITDTKLYFDIYAEKTTVKSDLLIKRNVNSEGKDLILDGVNLEIQHIKLDGKLLSSGTHYSYKDEALTIFSKHVPHSEFHLETYVIIHPEKNYALTGLYKTKSLYVTQCESSGFRHITFFIDRPDVMSKYEVTVCADKSEFPVLISNGDKIEEKNVEHNRHCMKYKDPHPKPSYLFGLVAGNLVHLKDTYVTKFSKKKVDLFVYSEPQHVSKLSWALECLKKSMKFDEDYFTLEYDLSRLNLVAVSDFNMGAMENKGLNIFNVDSLLASKKTSIDSVYERIVTVVSHEYFHNWTGNRVTLRDWFQLTLKEGLTVFREHLFSEFTVNSDTYLLDTVNHIRSVQFLEDASPIAHPIRPESYISMDNFYTSTVYDKGSQVMRMYFIILGEEYYKKGLLFYLKEHDGKGATCEDMNYAMEKAYKLKKNDEKASLDQYMRWYFQSGTPRVKYTSSYDEQKKIYTMTFKQYTEPTKNQPEKKPLFIPIKLGLINPKNGEEMIKEEILELTGEEQTFVFEQVPTKPIPSIFRSFSAPVHFEDGLTLQERILLMKFDKDSFVKYNCSVMLYMDQIIKNYEELLKAKLQNNTNPKLTPPYPEFIEALLYVITHPDMDYGVKAYMLSLPSDKNIMSYIKELDTDILYETKKFIYNELGKVLNENLYQIFTFLKDKAEDTSHFNDERYVDFDQINMRRFRTRILYLLSRTNYPNVITHIKEFADSPYPTSMLSSINCAAYFDKDYKEIVDHTYKNAKMDSQLLTNWLQYSVVSDREDIYNTIEDIEKEILKDSKNPNLLRAVYLSFTVNTKHFHNLNGKGYKLLAKKIIEVDSFNPQLAAQLCGPFKYWPVYNKPRQELMMKEMNKILEVPKLSKDVKELLLRITNKL